MREDFNRFLIRDGIVAGYGVFSPEGARGLCFIKRQANGSFLSLLPMTQGIIGGIPTETGAAPSRPDPQASSVFRWRA